jgi:hypothetical protein
MNGYNRLLDGRLGGYYRGLVALVPRVIGYNPKIWIQPVPTSGTRLGN